MAEAPPKPSNEADWSPAELADSDEARSVLPDWLRRRWLFHIPWAVPRRDARVYLIRLILVLIAGSIHVGLGLLYFLFDRPGLALINVAALLWYVMVVAIMRTGRHAFAMVLGFAEA
jgi:hypothetical protein